MSELFQAHIQKNHGGVGAVIHDTNLKPRPVSPPPPEVIMQARKEKEIEARRKRDADEIQRNATIGIDALPNLNPEQVQPDFPMVTPKTNKCVIYEAAGTDLTNMHTRTLESKMEDEAAFYCPHCDFSADKQIVMGDHVVLSHAMAHIARNSKPAEEKECTLCHTRLANVAQLQDHVRSEHPDVVVV